MRELEFRAIQPDDMVPVSQSLKEVGIEISPEILEVLFNERKFYGVILVDRGDIVGLMVTDPRKPPKGDEGYSVTFLPPHTKPGYEAFRKALVKIALTLVPIAELNITNIQFSEGDLKLLKDQLDFLLNLGFTLRGTLTLTRYSA